VTDIVRRLERALADGYVVEGRLGAGSAAVVVLARDRRHERQVAIKVLRPDFAESLGIERFLREIRLVAGFTHPRILPLYDSGEADGLLWFSMPVARGGSLRTRLSQQRPLPVAEAVRIALQVAAALEYAHGKGIVHRDIKPENILFEDGEVLLADFGLARDGQGVDVAMTDPGLAVGTPIYMSPEQAAGLPSGTRADIYALACVLYEMLDGDPPFSGRTAQAVLAQHRTMPPRDLTSKRADVSPRLRAVVERGLAKSPADRYSTAAAFADALRLAADETLPSDLADRLLAEGRTPLPWWRRTETLATAIVSLALGAGLAVFGEGGVPLFGAGRRITSTAAESAVLEPMDDPRRIAVLYLRGVPTAGLSAAVVDGLSEELIDALAQVDALAVTSVNGVRQFRGTAPDPREVGRRLAVRTVVEGDATTMGDSIRVVLRVVDARDGRQRRTLSVTRARSELAQMSGSVARALADELRRALGPTIVIDADRLRTPSAAAWEALQAAKGLLRLAQAEERAGREPEAAIAWARADSLLQAAAAQDTAWGDPLVLQARVRTLQAFPAVADLTVPRRRADSLTTEALYLLAASTDRRVDPADVARERGMAYWIRWQALNAPGAMERADEAFRRATALRPDMANAWLWLSEVYHLSGRTPESAVAARHALEADAWLEEAPLLYNRLFFAALDLERFGEAARWCREGSDRFRDTPVFTECELHLAARSASGDSAITGAWTALQRIEAADTGRRLTRSAPTRRLWVAAVLARSGQTDSARRVAARALDGIPATERLHFGLFEAYAQLLVGDDAVALMTLTRFLEAYPQDRAYVAQSALFRALQQRPRFQALVRAPA
jgi:serine/threonine-protein kinase